MTAIDNTGARGLVPRRRAPRLLPVVALSMTAVYLVWRSTTLGSGVTLVVSTPLFLAELWSAITLVVLVGQSRRSDRFQPSAPLPPPVSVAVAMGSASLDDLERTLIACRSLPGDRSVTVLDHRAVAGVPDLAAAHQAECRMVDRDPIDDPSILFDTPRAPESVLWLSAGQTPMPDVDLAAGRLGDPSVAVVQIGLGLMNRDSFAHLDRGRDEHALMREVLGPAMSTRGVAPWFGPGSVVRRDAVHSIPPGVGVEQLSIRLHRAGWRTEFDPRPLVRVTAPDTLADYLAARRDEAARRIALLRTSDSPLTGRGIPWRARANHLGLLTQFCGGIRLAIVVAVTAVTLITATMPFEASALKVAAAWALTTASVTAARRRIAGSTMAIGDHVRGAWRTLGADATAVIDAFTGRHGVDTHEEAARGWRSLGRLRALTALVVILDLALVARAATMVHESLLPAFTASDRILALAFAIGCLAPMADVVQLVVNRRQRRRQFRLTAQLDATVDGKRTTTIDLTSIGVAVELGSRPTEGDLVDLQLTLPRVSGDTSVINGMARVRSITALPTGAWRVGVEFVQLAPAPRAALIAYCSVDHPCLERHREEEIPTVAPADLDLDDHRRLPVRVLTAVAVCLGATTALAGPAYAAETAAPTAESTTVDVRVVDADGNPVSEIEIREHTDSWQDATKPEPDGVTGIEVPSGTTAVEVSLGDQRVVRSVTVDGDGTERLVVRVSRLVADAGADVLEINTGDGWRRFREGVEILPGHVGVRTRDGSVTKLVIEGGVEVSIPSGKVVGP